MWLLGCFQSSRGPIPALPFIFLHFCLSLSHHWFNSDRGNMYLKPACAFIWRLFCCFFPPCGWQFHSINQILAPVHPIVPWVQFQSSSSFWISRILMSFSSLYQTKFKNSRHWTVTFSKIIQIILVEVSNLPTLQSSNDTDRALDILSDLTLIQTDQDSLFDIFTVILFKVIWLQFDILSCMFSSEFLSNVYSEMLLISFGMVVSEKSLIHDERDDYSSRSLVSKASIPHEVGHF